ncbi:MAG: glycine C-acetyltransferase [Candidatus Limnocylindria bacterium]|nr:glycine C-acetyltransferase [Chloroflexota bacterium]MDQ3401343.1 glycine C-acetyltransferase [Chloroflexota bacterium]
MSSAFLEHLRSELAAVQEAGLYKRERVITSPQGAEIGVITGAEVLNFCANNYLGLSDHPRVVEAAHAALERWGYGMSSVRFICGTQAIHKELEDRLTRFLGTEDTILYSSCFDANGGLFETILGEEDAVISDALNHASIIDGIRLCKARRLRYANNDMADLESQLQAAAGARFRLIATDGVFSMDGIVANLERVCELADSYGAMVMVDDSHAVGFMGANGRGSHEHRGVLTRVDIITGTLGKALGGASGGYTSGRKEVVDLLRQRSRPYLFSNTLAPVIAATSIAVLDLIESSADLRARLVTNAGRFREGMTQQGFTLVPGDHAIVPVMLGDAALATRLADRLLELGIYVIAFSYPVVPKGQARIRVQLSAAHQPEHVDRAVAAFATAGRELGII